MASGNQEVELKFEQSAALGATFLARSDLADRAVTRRLVSTYFDSADRALLRSGYTLRVRHEDGRWVQTLKSCRAGDGAVRDEWSMPIRHGAPEVGLLPCAEAIDALSGVVVEAVFVVEVKRRSLTLEPKGCTVEISLDDGAVKCAGRSAPIKEVELELKSGRRAAFFTFLRDFRARYGLRPIFVSKAARGFAICDGAAGRARHHEPPQVSVGMTAGAAFKAAARAALTQIAENAEALRGSPATASPDVEIIHQMRVGLRRLRALIGVFKPVVGDSRAPVIRARLRRVANTLGPAREADVLLAGAFARAPWGGAGEGARKAFGRRLRAARKAAYVDAHALAADDVFAALLLDTVIWIESGPWTAARASGAAVRDAPVSQFAAMALDKAHRRVLRRSRHFARLDPDARHGLRIAAKTLRYTVEDLGPLFGRHPKRRRAFIALTKAALDGLGELNDLASPPPWGGAWPEQVITWRDARRAIAESKSAKALRRLGAASAFWPEPA